MKGHCCRNPNIGVRRATEPNAWAVCCWNCGRLLSGFWVQQAGALAYAIEAYHAIPYPLLTRDGEARQAHHAPWRGYA